MRDRLERYNVVWESPSADASGSMPLGNGDIGVNVWVEVASGDLLLLIGKTDAWDENSINLKLGRVRVRFSPPLSPSSFEQRLNVRTGDIEIRSGGLHLRIWVDANRPVIRIDADGPTPFEMRASLEMWRTREYAVKTQTGDLFKQLGKPDPYPTIISPDRLLPAKDRIVWCHHNEKREHDGFEINMRLQGLGGFFDRMPHPLLGRTFGGVIEDENFVSADETTLTSASPRTSHRLSIHALTTLGPATIDQWRDELESIIATTTRFDPAAARREHERWWAEFWDRSWIDIHAPDAFHVAQGYVLQRFMNACGGRGRQPIKFNGSIFTVGKPDDPDFRRWGGPGFWFMNTRLIYWPMLAAGDFELMRPWWRMYRDMLPLQQHRTKTYYGHGGAHYPETIMFWGAEVSAHYEWTRFEQRKSPEALCPYVTYYWSGGIELTLMLWSIYAHTLDDTFARETLVPIADAVTEFFDAQYPRDDRGKIRFEPAQALETWHDATNPLPEISGLRYVLPKLLELGPSITTAAQRSRWSRMLEELPPIPVGESAGRRVVLPAERFDRKKNTENPELYCVFPYRLFGIDKPDLALARNTFAARLHASHDCWSQDDAHAAMLGLTDVAREYVTKRAAPASHSDSRFPAFWNAFHDWIPDMDHGGVLQLALQTMLMQCEGRRIVLLPAWPREWDVDFKLHAPLKTVVEGTVRGGRIESLRVTPEERRKDVAIWPEQESES